MKKPILTPEQIKDAGRLKGEIKRWKERRKAMGLPHLQEHLAVMVGGITGSAVSQYANAKIPLNERALGLFSSALEVPPDQISPQLAARSKAAMALKGFHSPGMVYGWHELVRAIAAGEDALPDVCSVESPVAHLGGIVQPGDVLIVTRRVIAQVKPNDGVIIKHGNDVHLAAYMPHKGGGEWWARLSDGAALHSGDGLEIAYVVGGMPTVNWSRATK